MGTTTLLEALEADTRKAITCAGALEVLSLEQLTQRPVENAWNALECIAHLNLYGNFYLPEIGKRIAASPFKPTNTFNPGLLGNFFVNSMDPGRGTRAIKTFKDKNPAGAALDKTTLKQFIAQQQQLLLLLQQARKVDLNRTKTAISITRLLTLKLGDTLRFICMHNKRHLLQAQKAARLEARFV